MKNQICMYLLSFSIISFLIFALISSLSSAIIYALILCNSIANCYGILSQTISLMADDIWLKSECCVPTIETLRLTLVSWVNAISIP